MLWNIKSIISKGDYNYCKIIETHPNATERGYVLHHRVVVENYLGRMLEEWEVVHHRDGNKKNNNIDNLEIMSREEHARHHSSTGRTCVELICPNCGVVFSKEKRNIRDKQAPKCSRKCNGEYSRKIQLGRV